MRHGQLSRRSAVITSVVVAAATPLAADAATATYPVGGICPGICPTRDFPVTTAGALSAEVTVTFACSSALVRFRVDGAIEASELAGRVVVEPGARVVRSVVRGPAIIGRDALIEDAYVGPYTSVGESVRIRASEVENSIILEGSSITDVGGRLEASLLGRNASVYRAQTKPRAYNLMLGDRSQVGLI